MLSYGFENYSFQIKIKDQALHFSLSYFKSPIYTKCLTHEDLPVQLQKSFPTIHQFLNFLEEDENFVLDEQIGKITIRVNVEEDGSFLMKDFSIDLTKVNQKEEAEQLNMREEIRTMKEEIKKIKSEMMCLNSWRVESSSFDFDSILSPKVSEMEEKNKVTQDEYEERIKKIEEKLKQNKVQILKLQQKVEQANEQKLMEIRQSVEEKEERQLQNFRQEMQNWKNQFAKKKDLLQSMEQKIFDPERQYYGEIQNWKRHGLGIQFLSNGAYNEGEFKNNKINGKVICYHVSGDRYEGEAINDLAHGKGIFYKYSGDWQQGEWINNKRFGKFIYHYSNGRIKERIYDFDQMVEKQL